MHSYCIASSDQSTQNMLLPITVLCIRNFKLNSDFEKKICPVVKSNVSQIPQIWWQVHWIESGSLQDNHCPTPMWSRINGCQCYPRNIHLAIKSCDINSHRLPLFDRHVPLTVLKVSYAHTLYILQRTLDSISNGILSVPDFMQWEENISQWPRLSVFAFWDIKTDCSSYCMRQASFCGGLHFILVFQCSFSTCSR